LDVACGTGIVARLVAERVGPKGRVVGLDSSPAMLAVARSLSPDSGMAVEWSEGSALAIPFQAATFNLVFCQQGLQFFPDRPASLREMHRVLVRDGRLVLSVWRAIQYSPGFAVLAEALARHVNTEAGRAVQTPFSLGEVGELQGFIAAAGFRDVTIQPAVKSLRFPSPEDFVRRYVAGSALEGLVAQVRTEIPEALLGDVRQALRHYIDNEGLAFPIEAHVVTARPGPRAGR
jgi:SAM-dependent methyltransferase